MSRAVLLVGTGIVLGLVWARFTQVLHGTFPLPTFLSIYSHIPYATPKESILVFPTLGIQLETHLGHPFLPTLFTTHHFIPLSALEDVVIHEGFRRWNVRFYLAVLRRVSGRVEVRVAFEVRLPSLSRPLHLVRVTVNTHTDTPTHT